MIVFWDFSFAIVFGGSLATVSWKNALVVDEVQAKDFLSAMNNDCNMLLFTCLNV